MIIYISLLPITLFFYVLLYLLELVGAYLFFFSLNFWGSFLHAVAFILDFVCILIDFFDIFSCFIPYQMIISLKFQLLQFLNKVAPFVNLQSALNINFLLYYSAILIFFFLLYHFRVLNKLLTPGHSNYYEKGAPLRSIYFRN